MTETTNKKPKVLIGTPTYDATVHLTYMLTIMEVMSMLVEADVECELMHTNGSLIDMSRNKIAARVVNDKSITHLLFIDTDIGFTPESFVNLMKHSDLDVVGMVCPLREFPVKYNVVDLGLEVRKGLHLCGTIGTGVMLIRREVFDSLINFEDDNGLPAAPVYPDDGLTWQFFRTQVVDGRLRGEDVNFCLSWRKLGGKIHALTDCTVTHRGPHEFKYDRDLVQVGSVNEAEARLTRMLETLSPGGFAFVKRYLDEKEKKG